MRPKRRRLLEGEFLQVDLCSLADYICRWGPAVQNGKRIRSRRLKNQKHK